MNKSLIFALITTAGIFLMSSCKTKPTDGSDMGNADSLNIVNADSLANAGKTDGETDADETPVLSADSWWYCSGMAFKLSLHDQDLHLSGVGGGEYGIVLRANDDAKSYQAYFGWLDDMKSKKTLSECSQGKTMTPEVINGSTYLIFRDAKGRVSTVMQPSTGVDELTKRKKLNLAMMIMGHYTDHKGKPVTITEKSIGSDDYEYIEMTEGSLGNYICYASSAQSDEKPGFNYEIDEHGLCLMHGIYDAAEETWLGASAIPIDLKASKAMSRWPFTSETFVDWYHLKSLDKHMLRIMRNEILARHGHTFNEADMREYFKKQTWYKPNPKGNESITLNKFEQYNIDLIKIQEEETED